MDSSSTTKQPPGPIDTTIRTITHIKDQTRINSPSNLSPKSFDSAHSRLRRLEPIKSGGAPKRNVHKTPTKLKAAPSAPLKPLVPKTERKTPESDIHSRMRKNSDAERLTIDKNGSLRSRGLAVSNVGNNGRIYLRPTVLPANERYPTQTNGFPITPPSTAGLDAMIPESKRPSEATPEPSPQNNQEMKLQIKPLSAKPESEQSSDFHLSQWDTPWPTISRAESVPKPGHVRHLSKHKYPPVSLQRRRRAISDTTIPDFPLSPMTTTSDISGLKIVIAQNHDRPRTTEGDQSPLIDVTIPSHRIGLPRFTTRGTPVLRTSCYTPTEDLQSSIAQPLSPLPTSFSRTSYLTQSPLPYLPGASREPTWMMVQTPRRFLSSTPFGPVSSIPAHLLMSEPSTPGAPLAGASQNLLSPEAAIRMTYMSVHQVIEPSMFDALTFKPASDNRAMVRYSPISGSVTAATPPRLVAEITSPSFLDYELLSDFFLTFRAFLEPLDLLRMLIARFRWAAARDDETGMVVRVRTFVALRHWILNYFVDDFMINYELRVSFCNLVNDLINDLIKIGRDVGPHIKIVNELKKCWRRICAQFWDGEGFEASTPDSDPITPGGIAGHRDASLDPSYWEQDPNRLSMATLRRELSNHHGLLSIAQSTPGDAIVDHERPATPPALEPFQPLYQQVAQASPKHGLNPMSVSSIDVVSCSFPTAKNFQKLGLNTSSHSNPMRPATAEKTAASSSGGVATAPKGIIGKRVRPQHKRNGSMSDSLRHHDPQPPRRTSEQTDRTPFASTLVRGDLFPPSQALVEDSHPTEAAEAQRLTTSEADSSVDMNRLDHCASTTPGVKKIICSVKRVLSTRCHGSNSNSNYINNHGGVSHMPSNHAPSSAIVPQVCAKKTEQKPTVRIDVLGAEIAEAFKKAVRDEVKAEAKAKGIVLPESLTNSPVVKRAPDFPLFSPAHLDGSFEDLARHSNSNGSRRRTHRRGMSDGAITTITTGSKSIMIINDTRLMPFDLSTMPIPGVNPSVEAFAEAFMQNTDFTPPATPGQSRDRPRRSSFLMNHSFFSRPVTDSTPLPLFIPDLAGLLDGGCLSPAEAFRSPQTATFPKGLGFSLGGGSHFPDYEDFGDESYVGSRPLSDGALSLDASTVMQPSRQPSIISNFNRRNSFHTTDCLSIRRSISASSFASSANQSRVSSRLLPARMLRRRPAGNLRNATTVEELDYQAHLSMARSRSMTTMDTFTDSLRSSYIESTCEASLHLSTRQPVTSPSASEPAPNTFSLGALANNAPPHKKLSLFSTHSSLRHPMRPSFEAELRKLAAIPDDIDGGVETALMKLEGRYEKSDSPFTEQLPPAAPRLRKQPVTLSQLAIGNRSMRNIEKRANRNVGLGGDGKLMSPPTNRSDTSLESQSISFDSFLPAGPMRRYEASERGSAISDESYNSMPQLERLSTDNYESTLLSPQRDGMDQSIHTLSDDESITHLHNLNPTSQPGSFRVLSAKPSDLEPGISTPRIRISGSFLDDATHDDHGHNGISADLSTAPAILELIKSNNSSEFGETHNPTSPYNPPSPPMTLEQAYNMSKNASPHSDAVASSSSPCYVPLTDAQKAHHFLLHKPLPPTPGATPTTTHSNEMNSPRDFPPALTCQKTMDVERETSHLPFILAFDSDILAQQFTLIEKDALIEIDWRELVEMGWKNTTAGSWRSWLEFLRNSDSHGVEVVVARFNIMVKWAVSEILLTQNMEERARCIIKFIHIANHCRRYRNFATLAQITMALTSPEITRLIGTWGLVPLADVQIVRDLEQLMTPTRNFYNMRAEMETGSDQGCIPFVGVYTHDLIFNAQRPSEIASSPTTAPLVNFERYRIAASVVKTLLRLLEASTLYQFQPIEGITERCLWMCALSDTEIRTRAATLE